MWIGGGRARREGSSAAGRIWGTRSTPPRAVSAGGDAVEVPCGGGVERGLSSVHVVIQGARHTKLAVYVEVFTV